MIANRQIQSSQGYRNSIHLSLSRLEVSSILKRISSGSSSSSSSILSSPSLIQRFANIDNLLVSIILP
jgi:hypothetical protein